MKIFKTGLALIGLLTLSAASELHKSYFTTSKNKHSFSKQINNLNDEALDIAILGKSFFRIPWVEAPSATTARDGLGPLFNANACISCHPNNGIGNLFTKSGEISRSNIIKVGIPSDDSKEHQKMLSKMGFVPDPVYGGQISINGIFGVPFEAKPDIKFEKKEFTFPDGEKVTLKKPIIKLKNLNYGELTHGASLSFRRAPALVGLGLLEMVSDKDILANEDINDKDNDGISGKANIVYSPYKDTYKVGRYTYKASAPSVLHQVAGAANNDMSLTSPIFPNDNCTDTQKECLEAPKGRSIDKFDLPMQRLKAIAFYLKTLKTPIPKETEEFKEGKEIFNQIGCVNCHKDSFITSNGIKIAPYSDMLLHDMGEELSDGRVEFKASPREWRTTPLWGIGLYEKTLGNTPNYLHDGRASSLIEAILWHGGEAKSTKDNFINLTKEKRDKLIKFLGEL